MKQKIQASQVIQIHNTASLYDFLFVLTETTPAIITHVHHC